MVSVVDQVKVKVFHVIKTAFTFSIVHPGLKRVAPLLSHFQRGRDPDGQALVSKELLEEFKVGLASAITDDPDGVLFGLVVL